MASKRRNGDWSGSAGFLIVIGCGMAALLAGCESFRLHDAGRSDAANQANTIAGELSGNAGAVFGPMEDNLDAVAETQKTLRDLSNAQRFETFKAVLSNKSADDLAGMVIDTLSSRVETIELVDKDAAAAAEEINAQLDRQKAITQANDETVASKSSIKEALDRIKKRLDWIEKINTNLDKIGGIAAGAGFDDALPSISDADKAAIDGLLAKAQAAIGAAEDDQRVAAAVKLLKQAVQEIAALEQARVIEMKRHLSEIERLRSTFETRDRISVCVLLIKAMGELYPALSSKKEPFEQLVSRLANMKAGSKSRYDCLEAFGGPPPSWPIKPERAAQVQKGWSGGTLANFVTADIGARQDQATAPRLVAALSVLLFYEREYFETVRLDLAREDHRYSVRLSKVNAQERARLVQELAEALDVYYQGGIKPEEVADLFLMAGQVGALMFIGVKQ